ALGASLNTCLLAGNHAQHELTAYVTKIDNCTIANNTIDTGYVIYVYPGGLTLTNSIIDEPANGTFDYTVSGDLITASNLMLVDASAFPTGSNIKSQSIIAAEPTFVDAANGDYHLQATSWGIDFAPVESGGTLTDLDGNPRNVNLAQVPDFFGLRDLGAYER